MLSKKWAVQNDLSVIQALQGDVDDFEAGHGLSLLQNQIMKLARDDFREHLAGILECALHIMMTKSSHIQT
jgi:hypothetical protein